jgi:uncharacterized OsmC-like protein
MLAMNTSPEVTMGLLHSTRDSAQTPLTNGVSDPESEGDRISARVHTIGCSGLRTAMVRGFRLTSGDGADVAGFDLGPSPEEHFLAALGASVSQTIAHLACIRDLSIDRIDVDALGEIVKDHNPAHVAGHLKSIRLNVEIASDDELNLLQALEPLILDSSPLARGISLPIELDLTVIELAPGSGGDGDDWEI